MKIIIFAVFFFLQMAISLASQAESALPQKSYVVPAENSSRDNGKLHMEYRLSEDDKKLVTSDFKDIKESITNLKGVVEGQSKVIDTFYNEIKPSNKEKGMTFEIWTGILLAVSALVLGAVGIGLAVFSFIGYKELINKGVEKATTVATEISEKVAGETISLKVEEEAANQIEKLIADGTFDNVIKERVDKYIYRGIGNPPNEDSPEEERDED